MTGSVSEFVNRGNFTNSALELWNGPVQPYIQEYNGGCGQWLPGGAEKTARGMYLLTCGASKATKFSNIYDLLGNVQEYCNTVIEETDNYSNGYAKRGGHYMGNAAQDTFLDWHLFAWEDEAPFTGFRVTLLLTENG